MREMQADPHEIEVTAQGIVYWLERESDTIADGPSHQFHLAVALLQLGSIKFARQQRSEAYELISRAESICSQLVMFDWEATRAKELFEGKRAATLKLMQCKSQLARVCWSLGEQELAISQAEEAEEMIADELSRSPDDLSALLLQLDLRLFMTMHGVAADQDRTTQITVPGLLADIERLQGFRPNHRGLFEIHQRLLLFIARSSLAKGDRETALSRLRAAAQECDSKQSELQSLPIYVDLKQEVDSLLSQEVGQTQ